MKNKDLLAKLKKNSTIKDTAILADSKIYGKKDMIATMCPMINLALSARLDGGLTPGHTMIAGPSKHFKSMFALMMAGAYLDKYEDAILLFYDSEFGTPEEYFKIFKIDPSRVIHTPITDIEMLRTDMANQLHTLERGEKVVIVIDSIGNLASGKEVADALSGSDKADMTRAKVMKSLFRIVTPHLTIKDIPLITVNHSYKTMEMFSKDVVAGGTGAYYSADNVWIIGRRQNKNKASDKEIAGWDFVIVVDKSRYVREKAKIPITVTFDRGINKYSGLFDLGLEMGVVQKAEKRINKQDAFEFIDSDGVVISEPMNMVEARESEVWDKILADPNFKSLVEDMYSIGSKEQILFRDEDIDLAEETDEERK